MSRNEQILQMVKDGRSYKQVAEAMGMTRGAVSGVCVRAGLKTNPEHAAKNRSEAKKGKPQPWARGSKSERVTKAVNMRQSGKSLTEIAKELGYADASGVFYAVKRRLQSAEAAE